MFGLRPSLGHALRAALIGFAAVGIALLLGSSGHASRIQSEDLGNPQASLFEKARESGTLYRRPVRKLSDVTGTITPGGSPLTVTIANANDNASITFSGTANQRVALNITSVSISFSYVSILKPDGSTLVSGTAVFTSGKFIDTVTLPTTGTYTIYIDPYGSATGSMTLTLYDVPADASGTITPGGSSVTATTTVPGQNAVETWSGTQGDRISMNATNITLNSGYEIVRILKPDGSTLAGSGATSSHYFFDTMTLPTTGTYKVVVDPQDAATGSTTLTMYTVPADNVGKLAIGGNSRTATVTIPGHNPTYTFRGSAGEPVKVTITGSTILYSNVSIKNPDGSNLITSSVFTGSATVGPTVLPVDGTYSLVVDPVQEDTGSMTLKLAASVAWESYGRTRVACHIPSARVLNIRGNRAVHRGGFGSIRIGGIHAISGAWCLADPVNSLTGAYSDSTTDLTLGGQGLPFLFTRSYNSGDSTGGRLGPGWTDSYAASLAVSQNGDVTLHGEDGQEVQYALQEDGSFVGDAGARSTLTSVTGGYQLVRDDQVVYRFDSQGKLTSETDPNGNALTLSYDGSGRLATIVDDSGRMITFTSNADGTLSGISLPDGRSVSYGYTSGRLTSFTDPASRTTTYHYDANGRLDRVTDPNGHALVQNTYGTDGRVTQQTDALGHTTTFSWDSGTQTETATDPRGNAWKDVYSNNVLIKRIDPLGNVTQFGSDTGLDQTSVTAPNGGQTTMTYDSRGNLLTATGPSSMGSPQKTYTWDAKNNLQSVTDARAKQTTFDYDTAGNLTKVTQASTVVAQYAYNGSGELTSTTDGRGHQTTYTYDVRGNLASVTDAAGDKTTYTYDAAGRLLTKVDPLGNVTGGNPAAHTTTYTYDANGNMLSEVDPLGNKTTFTYDAAGNLTSSVDPRGNAPGGVPSQHTTSYTYDAQNRLLSITAPSGAVTAYGYDAAGNQVTTTDPDNHVTTNAYDAANRLASVTTPLGEVTTYTYDANGSLQKITDPRGNAVTYTTDAAGRLLTRTDALGHRTTYAYDAVGNLHTVTDPNNHTTTYTYDAAGRVLTEAAPDGGVTTYTYDAEGNQLTLTDPNNHTATSTYDAVNRLASTTSPKNETTTYSYDAAGRVVQTVEPRGNVSGGTPSDYATQYAYDAAGHLLSTTDPLGHATSETWDEDGNRVSVTDAKQHTTTFTYDADNRLTTLTTPGGDVTTYTYNGAGNVLTRVDGNNHTTTYGYDADNRQTGLTSPLGQQWTYGYDAAGNHTTTIDANGNATQTAGDGLTTYSYDAANELTGIDYSDSTPDVTLGYDAAGNRTSMVDGAGTQSYTYSAANRLTGVTRGSDSFAYTYDAAGNLTRRTYPDSTVVDYGYDEDSRLSSVTTGGQTTSYAYDAAGNLTSTTLPSSNGYVETRTYDRAGRLTEVKTANGASVLSDFTSTLDAVGNPTTITRSGAISSTSTFTYDANDRLTSVCFQSSCPGGSDPFIRWTYDHVGNRLTEERPGGTTSYTYNAGDELTSAGSTSYGYDADGNLTSAGSRTFTYDLANRLVSTASGGSTTSYAYDGDGNRVSEAASGSTTQLLWDSNGQLPQLALERDGAGALLRRYVYGVRRISMTAGGSAYYYAYDTLGSVTNLMSATGSTEWTYDYEPFGAVRTETQNDPNAPTNRFRFAGELRDSTGLYDLRARMYDPATGRFVALDPAPPSTSEPAISPYAYSGDRPTVMSDPSGMTFHAIQAGTDAAGDAASAIPGTSPAQDPDERELYGNGSGGGGGGSNLIEELMKKLLECIVTHGDACNPRFLSRDLAYAFLIGYNRPKNQTWKELSKAKAAVNSFAEWIYLWPVRPGWKHWRFYGGTAIRTGNYLTTKFWAGYFKSPADAIRGLHLGDYGNTAEYRQVVTAEHYGLTLFGTIKGSPVNADEYVVGDQEDFDYAVGERNWWNKKP